MHLGAGGLGWDAPTPVRGVGGGLGGGVDGGGPADDAAAVVTAGTEASGPDVTGSVGADVVAVAGDETTADSTGVLDPIGAELVVGSTSGPVPTGTTSMPSAP